MTAKITSISLTEAQKSFLEEHNLSPTALIKGKIEEIQDNMKVSMEKYREIQRRLNVFIKNFEHALEFIEENKLTASWVEYKNKKNVLE